MARAIRENHRTFARATQRRKLVLGSGLIRRIERLAFTGSAAPTPEAFPPHPAPETTRRGVDGAQLERKDVLAYRGLLAFTFVLIFRPQDSIPFLHALHLGDLTAAFALTALVWGRMSRGLPPILVNRELGWVMAFGGVMVATAPFSLWPGGAMGVFVDLYSKIVLIFALMVNTVTTRTRLTRVVSVVVLGTSYIAVRAVIDYARGVNLVENGRISGAVDGLFGNPNDLALNLVVFLPLAIALVLDREDRRLFLFRLSALIGLPAIAAAIIFSKSRGGTIGLVGMLLVLLFQMRRIRPQVVAFVVVTCLAAIPLLPSSFTDRMSSIFKSEEDTTGSREARKQLMREAMHAFLENPVFGLGAGQFVNYDPGTRQASWRETHNAVLQVAAELGVGGIVVFGGILAGGFAAALRTTALLRRARRGHRARAPTISQSSTADLYAAALLSSLTGWLLAAMFGSVAYYWTLYIVIGLAVTHRDITARELRLPDQPKRESYFRRVA
jgi:O-antigen ligase